jgi:hydroxymethylpyrimidine/phosphomethylpyrimidine kinase
MSSTIGQQQAIHAPVALSIGGSDSSGGAGIQADLSTFAAHGVFGAATIARVTAQNTRGVRRVLAVPTDLIQEQLMCALDDLPVRAAKTGSLGSAETVAVVASELRGLRVPIVVDPVLVAKSGARLLGDEGLAAIRDLLLPLAEVITPNAAEAAALSGIDVRTVTDAERAAMTLLRTGGPRLVVITGLGDADAAIDLVATPDGPHRLVAPRVAGAPTHGAGCVFSAAITANLALGGEPFAAIVAAKEFTRRAIERGLRLGPGRGPVAPAFVLATTHRQPVAVRPGEEIDHG